MTTSVQERAVVPVPGASAGSAGRRRQGAVRPSPTPLPFEPEVWQASPATAWRLVTDSAGVSALGPRGPVGGADLEEDGEIVRVDIWLDGGTLPHRLRGDLAGSIGDHPALRPGRLVVATLPHGEANLLEGLRSQLRDVRTRVAGSTCFVEGRAR